MEIIELFGFKVNDIETMFNKQFIEKIKKCKGFMGVTLYGDQTIFLFNSKDNRDNSIDNDLYWYKENIEEIKQPLFTTEEAIKYEK